ncbi:YciI family protein [Amycolatopsis sp. H20-H5]|uniref:YciI family protein n=1 Tax=Amycolatopsis sp. H20-H5 TaxID=3046309 RepID=UPI002DB9A47E|nr:YciI family protein [Amycolatopsis sp. H20-H5]MEC3980560.1 YciI family protein [Amycolatopsis sp. H20-H5]
MAWYLVEITYVQEKLAEVRPRHRDFLRALAAEGKVAVAGPLADGLGGITLYQAEDDTALKALIDQDPYHLEGVIAERTVREYKPVIGAWVPPAN